MEDKLIELLETFGYPVNRQGSMSDEEEYPDTFFTFWNRDSGDHSHYDNRAFGTRWIFDVNVYSADPELAYSVLREAIDRLKAGGWIVSGKGHDVASDEKTHIGRGVQVDYLEIGGNQDE